MAEIVKTVPAYCNGELIGETDIFDDGTWDLRIRDDGISREARATLGQLDLDVYIVESEKSEDGIS